MDALSNLILVVISEYMYVCAYQITIFYTLNLQCYMSIITQNVGKHMSFYCVTI